jgi:AraC-like DNA-binding protein
MIKFSTDDLPEAESFDRWREEFVGLIFNADVLPLHQSSYEPFRTLDRVLPLGDLALTDCSGVPKGFARSRKQASDGDDGFSFCVNRRGRIELAQAGSTVAEDRANIVMFDHGKPLERYALTHNAYTSGRGGIVKAYSFIVPRRRVLEAAPDALESIGKVLQRHGRALQYVVWYSENLLRTPGLVSDPTLAERAGEHIFDFLAVLLGPTRDAAEVAAGQGLRAARLMAILSYIDNNITNPELSVRTIAEAHGISARYVSQLMEDRGETAGRYILRSRLERVARLLSDQAAPASRFVDIALACGFNDISSFNRAFKSHFGESPRSFRQANSGR